MRTVSFNENNCYLLLTTALN